MTNPAAFSCLRFVTERRSPLICTLRAVCSDRCKVVCPFVELRQVIANLVPRRFRPNEYVNRRSATWITVDRSHREINQVRLRCKQCLQRGAALAAERSLHNVRRSECFYTASTGRPAEVPRRNSHVCAKSRAMHTPAHAAMTMTDLS